MPWLGILSSADAAWYSSLWLCDGGTTLSSVAEIRNPKTVTLELLERQAEGLLVAAKLGDFQLAVRPLVVEAARSEDKHEAEPVWASDVSPALGEIAPLQPKQ